MGTVSVALILLMVGAAGVRQDVRRGADLIPRSGQPLALFRPSAGGPSLRQWLVSEARDDRQHLTIVARYRSGEPAAADAALTLADEARAQGVQPRIIIEPSDVTEVFATLSFDGRRNWHVDCTKAVEGSALRTSRRDTSCD